MKKIKFNELEHKYYLIDENGNETELVSVTTLLKKHNISSDYSFVKEEVVAAKAERGKVVHKELENYIKENKIGFTSELEKFIELCSREKIKPLKSEFIVFNDEIAGTVDLEGVIDGKETFLGDFKTTLSLNKESVAWQLSLYQYLIGKNYDKLLCLHFPDPLTLKVIEVSPIPKEEIEKLLECERNFILYEKKTMELDFIDTEKILTVQRALKSLEARKKELETEETEIKEALIRKMEENGVKSIDNNLFKITYIDSYSKESIDTTRLKKEKPEIAAEYIKVSTVKPSVRITLKSE